MKKHISLTFLFLFLIIITNAQNVGIGTKTPLARLHVTDSAVLFSSTGDIPATPTKTPITGVGRRMLWYPDKAAFRAGYVDGDEWDLANIGNYSFAGGQGTYASGIGSFAMGHRASAFGNYSIAMGFSANAFDDYSIAQGFQSEANAFGSTAIGYWPSTEGNYATAMGYKSNAYGNYSTALGDSTFAGGDYSTAIGYLTQASGYWSTALGTKTTASGIASTAMGNLTTADGDNSTAMGTHVTTNGMYGAFIIGDNGDGRNFSTYYSNSNNSMQMVFAGGYRLYTGSSASGVYMNGGDNSWSAVSDSTKKEKILPVDGENFLSKIAKLKLCSWNYKGQDSRTFRHYGPMAQDFHNAFGKDALGTIGCDTLINQQDFLGVSFIAIQALEKRTEKIEQLQKQNNALEQEVGNLQQNNLAMQKQMETLLSTVASLNKQVQTLAAKTDSQSTIAANK